MNVLLIPAYTLPDFSEDDLARIRDAAGPDACVCVARTRDEALAAAADADVILGFLTPKLFAAAQKLRWVHAVASGVDGYLFPEFRASGVLLTGEKGLVGEHLADHAFALLLALVRATARSAHLGADAWDVRMELRSGELELGGLALGIVGFGGTGRAVARRAAAFGMRCHAIDAEPVEPSPEVGRVETTEAFGDLLSGSDVVAICCPLTDATRGWFDDDAFARMRRGSYLINVTRGEIVDGDALVRALASGRLAGAGLDVTPEEPLPRDHPLWSRDDVVMTPHIAGASQYRARRNLDRFCRNLVRLRTGRPLDGLIDKRKGY